MEERGEEEWNVKRGGEEWNVKQLEYWKRKCEMERVIKFINHIH